MTKNIINIGLPSKGRLKHDTINIFKKKKLNIYSERGERDLFGYIKKLPNIKVVYLHAREIIERLGDGSLDLGFSGLDLLKESEVNIQKKINVVKEYNFGKATLVIAIPDPWIDVQTIADLEEIAFEFKDKKKKVYVVGISFGAFVVQDSLAEYGNIADGYLIMVGRLNIPKEVWSEFSKGNYVGFGYDEKGGSKIMPFSAEEAGMGGDKFIENKNTAKL